ncbi:methyltransferase [Aestuariicoccus sp. MJ-SS9]|uniref:methyltransferase n=1 Tax=Aestuariicoccus sp. MJ-SS9 TaxID=3079855 RepID=UPI00290A2F4B|nr:methyltransferase [Aestuariicoccus sp. MJ-SS9]MDU8910935.1 methyltransferase [Aestuariicoccus sp. MJ-SS9]
MAADDPGPSARSSPGWRTRLARIAARPGFQRWAARFPIARLIAKREGEELFDLVQGFVSAQVLFAIVELNLLHRLMDGPLTAGELAQGTGITPDRMGRLAQAGAALGLLRRDGADRFGITRKGAALVGVPGLEQMIRHHDVLYRDLADPVAFLKGDTDPELARFWPYVFGAQGAVDPATTATYSELMAQSQGLVAQDTLACVSLQGVTRLLDVGGGTGAFAEAAAEATPGLAVTLFDLPKVIDAARTRLAGRADRIMLAEGSFRDDPLPGDADAISLIRVLYDHRDDTVRALLAKCHDALPKGGRLIVSEPMSGGARPDPAGDVYFAFYCMAMGTGTVRSQVRIAALCREAGFDRVQTPRARRPFVTSVVIARKN